MWYACGTPDMPLMAAVCWILLQQQQQQSCRRLTWTTPAWLLSALSWIWMDQLTALSCQQFRQL
jgi:hypothetical protein